MKNKQIIVTTSWDDGHKLDLKLAKLLKKYNIKGTFYVSPKSRKIKEENLLTNKEIIALSKDFEVGAHTMTHPRLTKISLEEAKKEIVDSKKYLEKLTGKEIKSFCYPHGDYNKEIKKLVKFARLTSARTTNQIFVSYPKDTFELFTAVKTSPISIRGLIGNIKFIGKISIHTIPFFFGGNWNKSAKKIFDYVYKNGGVYHLWGHSWEVNRNKEWRELENLLKYISNKNNVRYLTNSQLIELLKIKNEN